MYLPSDSHYVYVRGKSPRKSDYKEASIAGGRRAAENSIKILKPAYLKELRE